jgi:hypothetical protein
MEINLREMLKLKDELYKIISALRTNFWKSQR